MKNLIRRLRNLFRPKNQIEQHKESLSQLNDDFKEMESEEDDEPTIVEFSWNLSIYRGMKKAREFGESVDSDEETER